MYWTWGGGQPDRPFIKSLFHLFNGENRVLLAVDRLLPEEVQGDPVILLRVDDPVVTLPGDGGRRLAPEPDVVAEGVALLDLYVVHAGVVDKRLD